MTKQEFEKRIGAEISQKDYSIVEHVYTWHPSISEAEGKEQIAELYKSFGMPIIKNMMEAAKKNTEKSGFSVRTMNEVMCELMGVNPGPEIEEPDGPQMYVLTNARKLRGANIML